MQSKIATVILVLIAASSSAINLGENFADLPPRIMTGYDEILDILHKAVPAGLRYFLQGVPGVDLTTASGFLLTTAKTEALVALLFPFTYIADMIYVVTAAITIYTRLAAGDSRAYPLGTLIATLIYFRVTFAGSAVPPKREPAN